MRYIDANNKTVNVNFYEIKADIEIWESSKEKYGFSDNAVPRTIVGDKVFIGFDENSGPLEYSGAFNSYIGYYNQIVSAIEAETGSSIIIMPEKQSWHRWLPLILMVLLLVGYLHPLIRKGEPAVKRLWFGSLFAVIIVSLLVLVSGISGSVLQVFSGMPFPFFVFVLAFLDGFNPCAFSVFIIFMSLLSHSINRASSAILGGVFIFTSAAMYFIFIMLIVAAGTVLYMAAGQYIFIVIGLVMTAAGILNIKEYWFFKAGPSLTISKKKMTDISRRAGRIVSGLGKDYSSPKALAAAVASTAVLAALVNLVELGCTAILPAVYMTELLKHHGSRISLPHIGYTLFYAAVYVVPLIVLLLVFRKLLPSQRLTETQGRIMKLFSGLIMLMLGLLLLFRPESLVFG